MGEAKGRLNLPGQVGTRIYLSAHPTSKIQDDLQARRAASSRKPHARTRTRTPQGSGELGEEAWRALQRPTLARATEMAAPSLPPPKSHARFSQDGYKLGCVLLVAMAEAQEDKQRRMRPLGA